MMSTASGLENNTTNASLNLLITPNTPQLPQHYDSFLLMIFIAVVLGVWTLWTIVGNITVGVALYRYRELRTMSNLLIGNLALSDFLLGTTVLPISVSHDLLGYWVFGRLMCIIWLCIDVLYCTASIWGLCTIAVDRYTATVYPMWYHEQRSPKRALIHIFFVWVFSIVVSFAPFIGWRHMIPTLYTRSNVTLTHDCLLFTSQSYVMYSATGSFILPLILMLFLYMRIFVTLHGRSQDMRKNTRLYPLHKNKASERKVLVPEKESTDLATVARDSVTTPTSSYKNIEIDHGLNMDENEEENELEDKELEDEELEDKELEDEDIVRINKLRSFDNASYNQLQEQSMNEDDGFVGGETTASDRCSDASVIKNLYISDSEHENIQLESYKRIKHCESFTIIRDDDIANENCPHINFDQLSENGDTIQETLGDNGNGKKNDYRRRRLSFLWMRNKKIQRNKLTSSMKRRFEIREQRATKRMAFIMICFIVCWLPFFLMYVIRSICRSCPVNKYLQATVTWLGYVNSGLNPVLYTLFNEDFKKAFRHIIGLKSRAQKLR